MSSELIRVGLGVLVVRDKKFLLGKRLGQHMPGFYAAPGGHLEYRETFAECARREVREETGLHVTSVKLLIVGNYIFNDKHYVDIDVVAEAPSGDPVPMEPHKCANWDWYGPANLPSPLFVVTERMINSYLQQIPMSDCRMDELWVSGTEQPFDGVQQK